MNRRQFLKHAGVAGVAVAALGATGWAADLPRDLRITRIVAFNLVSRRPKRIGKNSRRDDHGDRETDRVVRLYTNAGLEGLGNCRANEKTLAGLLGKNPFDFLNLADPTVRSPLSPGSMPLWDLAGRALGKPVHELLGGKGARGVPVYDTSFYFSDLMPEYAGRWQDRFKEEIDMGLARGHRAFKVKIGRGAKWMPAEEGFERDKAVIRLFRAHIGADMLLGVDANNGYGLPRTKQLLTDLPDLNLAFIEEMFHEVVPMTLNIELKAFLKERGLKTLVADGELQKDLEGLRPFIEARVIDLCQLDMNTVGIESIRASAAMALLHGLRVAPHNWGSLVAFYEVLHVGRAVSNYYIGEHDPLDSDVLVADGYTIKGGLATVPDAPGFGLRIDEAKFAAGVKPLFDLKL